MLSREYCEIFKNSYTFGGCVSFAPKMVLTGYNYVFLSINEPQRQYCPFIIYHKFYKTFELSLKLVPKNMSSFKLCYGDQPLVVCVVVVSKFDPGLLIPISLCLNSLENNFRLFINFILGKMLTVTLQRIFHWCNILPSCCEPFHA